MKKKKRKQYISWMLILMIIWNMIMPVHTVYAGEMGAGAEMAGTDLASPSSARKETGISKKATHSSAAKVSDRSKIKPGDPMATPATALKNEMGEDKTGALENLRAELKQGEDKIEEGGKLNGKEKVSVDIFFDVPVEGDEPTPPVIINRNDTAEFDLSDGFKLLEGKTVELKEKSGTNVIGHAKISLNPDTKVVSAHIIFDGDEEVFDGTLNTVSGWFHLDFDLDTSDIPQKEGEKQIYVLDKSYTVVIPPVEIVYEVKKSGNFNMKNHSVEWKVEVSASQGGEAVDLAGYKFSDDLKTVGEYLTDSFQIGGEPKTPVHQENKLEYVFPAESVGKQIITFETKVPEELYYALTPQTIRNKAELYNEEYELKKDDEAIVYWVPKWIEKKGEPGGEGSEGIYNPKDRTITWTIIANQNGVPLKGVVITDVLSPEIRESDKKLKFYSAKWETWNGSAYENSTEIEPNEKGEYEIGDIDSQIRLTIVTKVPNDEITAGKTTYYNEASMKWEGTEGVGTGKIGVGIGYDAIHKTGKADTSKGTVSWTVTVKPQGQIIPDAKVYDLLIYENSGVDLSSLTGIPKGIKNQDLKAGYGLKYKAGTFNGSGLELKVIPILQGEERVGDLLEITGYETSEASFTYETEVMNPAVFTSVNGSSVQNTAALFSKDIKLKEDTPRVPYNSRMLWKEMLKREAVKDPQSGVNNKTQNSAEGFDYKEKSVIFRLNVNANGLDLSHKEDGTGAMMGSVTVKDTLPKGWILEEIEKGSPYLIFTGEKSGDSNGSITASPSQAVEVEGLTHEISEDNSTITFTFKNLDKPYVILVKAKPDADTVKGYFNNNQTTTVTNRLSLTTERSPEVSVTRDVQIISKVLNKSSSVPVPGVLLWTVEYQPSEISTMALSLRDTLPAGIDVRMNQAGQLLMNDGEEDNFKVNEMILQADGSYTPGAEVELKPGKNLFYDNTARELRFDIPDPKTAYRFSYITDVTGEPGNVSNKVLLFGEDSHSVETSQSYVITNADGGASMKRNGWIAITKTDPLGNPLKGAAFTLFAKDKTTIIRKGVTGSDGLLKMKVIPDGEYILRETAAPAGYVLDGTAHTLVVKRDGKKVTASIDGKEGENSNAITIENHKDGTVGNLKITKTVAGNGSDIRKKFDFTVTFDGKAGPYSYVGDGVLDGVISNGGKISLAHGESITIQGVPKDTGYVVTEADYSADGYTSTSSGAQGIIQADEVQTAAFMNTRELTPGTPSEPEKPQKPEKPEKPGKPGNSGGNERTSNSPGKPKKELVDIINKVPAGNITAEPEETVNLSDQVPKGAKWGNPEGLPKTGEVGMESRAIYGIILMITGFGALLLSLLLLVRARKGK